MHIVREYTKFLQSGGQAEGAAQKAAYWISQITGAKMKEVFSSFIVFGALASPFGITQYS